MTKQIAVTQFRDGGAHAWTVGFPTFHTRFRMNVSSRTLARDLARSIGEEIAVGEPTRKPHAKTVFDIAPETCDACAGNGDAECTVVGCYSGNCPHNRHACGACAGSGVTR